MATHEILIGDESVSVNLLTREGNRRGFKIPSIPLTGTVVREARDDCPTLRYVVKTDARVRIPQQELYGATEFDEALTDNAMLGHARFMLAARRRALAEAAQ